MRVILQPRTLINRLQTEVEEGRTVFINELDTGDGTCLCIPAYLSYLLPRYLREALRILRAAYHPYTTRSSNGIESRRK